MRETWCQGKRKTPRSLKSAVERFCLDARPTKGPNQDLRGRPLRSARETATGRRPPLPRENRMAAIGLRPPSPAIATNPAGLYLSLLGDLQRVVDLDPEVSDGALKFAVTK